MAIFLLLSSRSPLFYLRLLSHTRRPDQLGIHQEEQLLKGSNYLLLLSFDIFSSFLWKLWLYTFLVTKAFSFFANGAKLVSDRKTLRVSFSSWFSSHLVATAFWCENLTILSALRLSLFVLFNSSLAWTVNVYATAYCPIFCLNFANSPSCRSDTLHNYIYISFVESFQGLTQYSEMEEQNIPYFYIFTKIVKRACEVFVTVR